MQDSKHTYLALEYCEGGSLSNTIKAMRSIPEYDAQIGMRQILSAVQYMHKAGVCHRDLKPDNIMLSNFLCFEANQLKIIDFGLSTKFTEGDELTTVAGSPHYIAPQVIQGRYNHLCDLWSCGSILFEMLSGSAPFTGTSDDEVMEQVLVGKYSFHASCWADITGDARGLIQMLLRVSQTDRYTADQACSHPWIKAKSELAAATLLTSPRRSKALKN